MTVLQAIPLNIYTLRTLRSDESAGYITLGRTSDISARDTDGDDLRSAGIWMDVDDFFMSNPMDDFPFRLRQIASRGKLLGRIPRLEAP